MIAEFPSRIDVIDSHTAGEPTRCVLSGGPDLGSGPLSERLERFRREHDIYRRAILCEPRGSDVLVGALLVEPFDPAVRRGRHLLQQRRLSGDVRPRNDRRGRDSGPL